MKIISVEADIYMGETDGRRDKTKLLSAFRILMKIT